MTRSLLLLAVFTTFSVTASAQQVTGLSGWDLFLDPGHSRTENQGAFGYSEAENVVRVGLALREMLRTETDIDTVYMSRTNDQQQVGITQRTDFANSVAADFFHSIHSNAAAPNVNHVFVLWAQLRSGDEPAPPFNGGRRMSESMGMLLAQGMRIPASNNGAWGECAFYGTTSCRAETTTPKGSRNHVQSFSMMPSALSEAGFHTNPVQNQRKMNQDWPRLEARAMLWSIYDYHDIPRPPVRIATGIISDIETGLPINGATITIGDREYTTDTYESVFHRFSNDPEALRNGFYYLEDLAPGTHSYVVDAENFLAATGQITLTEDFFTFLDVGLLSTVPPTIVATQPVEGEENFRIVDPIMIQFSRPMDRASVEEAFAITPSAQGTFAWQDSDRRFLFRPDGLEPLTSYTVHVAESAQGAAGHFLDGNADGTAGGSYSFSFVSGSLDTEPPRIVASTPAFGTQGVELIPVVSVTYDELIDHASVQGLVSLAPSAGGPGVAGAIRVYDVGDQSVVSFFPNVELTPETIYRLAVAPGVTDLFGNEQTSLQQTRFTTGATSWDLIGIDDFEANVVQNWWAPQQSGSTTGIITDSTSRSVDTSVVNLLTGSTASLRVDYGWDITAGNRLIRQYLGGGAPRSVRFDSTYTMQAYVFGDGEGNRFRFAVRDRMQTGTGTVEVSPWYTVDWRGWKLVSWDMGGQVGSWIGDGSLDGELIFDSFQLTYTNESSPFGRYYFEDLRLARSAPPVFTEPGTGVPEQFRIHANFPNPFSSTTTLRFDLPAPSTVRATVYNVLGAEVARLVDGATYTAGTHSFVWDASDLAAGVYILRVYAGDVGGSLRMAIVR
ncbi:hypothetical protein BH23ACT11_BH23ACT11_04370 [soil metagenome]